MRCSCNQSQYARRREAVLTINEIKSVFLPVTLCAEFYPCQPLNLCLGDLKHSRSHPPNRQYQTLLYKYATAANTAANRTPSALLLFLLSFASDSLVDAAGPDVAVSVCSLFDTVTVFVSPCAFVASAVGLCVLVAVVSLHTLSPSETKLLTPLVASANTEATAEVASE